MNAREDLIMESKPDTIQEHDNKVLLDAAKMLETAARHIKKLTKTTACTMDYERAVLNVARANIEAALLRLK